MRSEMRRLLWIAMLPGIASADPRCMACHKKQVVGYARTAMANSLFRAHEQPPGRFTHELSGTVFHISSTRQTLERGGWKAEYPVEYVVGSGNHAFAYLVRLGEHLFQSPVSYYTRRKLWDVAPGYERDRSPDFTRPVTAECLWCHSGEPRPVAGSLNRYESPPIAGEAISCDRCHGSAEAHLKEPLAKNIVNPKRLPVRARDSICEQCHLGGEARIPNPGKKIGEFQPGMELEDVFSVFVFDRQSGFKVPSGLKVVSHVEQLALSLCAQKSAGRLWCGTCHDPHNRPTSPVANHRGLCQQCHPGALGASHPKGQDCVRCHMPQRPARDGGHTAFTDHRIQRPAAATEPEAEGPRRLVAWRATGETLGRRNLGLSNVTVGERDQSVFHLDAGFRLLSEIYESSPKDPAVLTSLGSLMLRKSRPKESLAFYERALSLEPEYAPHHVNVATAAAEAGDTAKAISHLERAIALDRSLEQAYRKLSALYQRLGQRAKARAALERYLEFMPGNLMAREELDLN